MPDDGHTINVGPVTVHDRSLPSLDEVRRLQALERFVASVFDEWVNTCADLMALYPEGGSWDETIPTAVEEIRALRSIVRYAYGEDPDVFLHDWLPEESDALRRLLDRG